MSAVAGVGAALFFTAVAGLPCASLDAKMWHGGARTSPTELSHSLRAYPGIRTVQYSAALILPWPVLRVLQPDRRYGVRTVRVCSTTLDPHRRTRLAAPVRHESATLRSQRGIRHSSMFSSARF